MHKPYGLPVYKTAPLLRILPPFIAGILLQWYGKASLQIIAVALTCFTIAYILFGLLPLNIRFKLTVLQGILLHAILAAAAMLITWQKDIRHHASWYGNHYRDSAFIVAVMAEPLEEKNRSYKTTAFVETVITGDTVIDTKGTLLLYFSKDTVMPELRYGDRVLIHTNLQSIKNSGNPGAFNYEQYAAFQQLFHNVFLKPANWQLLNHNNNRSFGRFITDARERILSVLRNKLPAAKDELGIAEALLIGYTHDLDKDLVQAYSNTGVVHIIAISGMHLGLIYVILVWLFARIPGLKKSGWLQALLILSCLWLFSLLTGGAASVIRSAVMFTFITVGKAILGKKSSIFNSLAASALVMLCYNPYYLWDVGFQLSYLAVTGIVVFQRPIAGMLYIKNKWADKIWQLTAVSLAAQLLTFPVCIYYFHQFPNLFLITNLVAVPLSTVILFTEIALLAFSWLPFAGVYIGKLAGWLLERMNQFILSVNKLPHAVWDHIPATVTSTWLLYAVIIALGAWLMQKNRQWLKPGLWMLLGWVTVHAFYGWRVQQQQKLVVYNVPRMQAIDFISGSHYYFKGDRMLSQPGMLQNFHLKPGRIAWQLEHQTQILNGLSVNAPFFLFGGKKILLFDNTLHIDIPPHPVEMDLIIISGNPTLSFAALVKQFNCKQYVADASNSLWKIEKWKQDCDQLNLRFHSIPEEGAFVMDL